jgi:hypothetical protein
MCVANKLERFVHSKPDPIFVTKMRGKCKVLHMDMRLGLQMSILKKVFVTDGFGK